MPLSITFLGTGGSSGIPQIGCSCSVCRSEDPRNNRTRTSICIHYNSNNIIIDTSPEFRVQVIQNKIETLDGIIFTHAHADHLMGLADIRAYNFNQKKPIDIYASENTIDRIKQSFSYIFNAPEEFKKYYPQVKINEIHGSFSVCGLEFQPFTVFHGRMPVLAFRFENVAYITDVNNMPEEIFAYLNDLDILILAAFRLTKHVSHYSLDESISIAKRIGARQTYFTHIGHDIDHEKIEAALPDGINLAYDGLKISPQK